MLLDAEILNHIGEFDGFALKKAGFIMKTADTNERTQEDVYQYNYYYRARLPTNIKGSLRRKDWIDNSAPNTALLILIEPIATFNDFYEEIPTFFFNDASWLATLYNTSNSSSFPYKTGANSIGSFSAGFNNFSYIYNASLYGWGSNNHGELGNGTSIDKATDYSFSHTLGQSSDFSCSCTDNFWKVLDMGPEHSAAIDIYSRLWLWGFGRTGAIGDGFSESRSSPTMIAGNYWKSVSLGGDVYEKDVFGLVGWGENYTYDGSPLPSLEVDVIIRIPDQITLNGTKIEANTIKDIAVGYYNTHLLQADGTLWGCGFRNYLGINDAAETPTSTFVQQTFSTDWESIHGGGRATIGIKKDGTIWGWGYNRALGLSINGFSLTPTLLSNVGGWVSADVLQNMSVLKKADGTIWYLGYTPHVFLNDASTPMQLAAGEWKKVRCSFDANMFFFINEEDDLYGMGTADPYSLNFGNSLSSVTYSSPTKIGTSKWKEIWARYEVAYAIKQDGTLWGWGYSPESAIGIGNGLVRSESSSSPILISSDNEWIKIDGTEYGQYSSIFALKADGTLWVWGSSDVSGLIEMGPSWDQLGLFQPIYQPTCLPSYGWKDIHCGYTHIIGEKI